MSVCLFILLLQRFSCFEHIYLLSTFHSLGFCCFASLPPTWLSNSDIKASNITVSGNARATFTFEGEAFDVDLDARAVHVANRDEDQPKPAALRWSS